MYIAKQHIAVRQKESVYNMGYIHDTTHKVKHIATMMCKIAISDLPNFFPVYLINLIFFLETVTCSQVQCLCRDVTSIIRAKGKG